MLFASKVNETEGSGSVNVQFLNVKSIIYHKLNITHQHFHVFTELYLFSSLIVGFFGFSLAFCEVSVLFNFFCREEIDEQSSKDKENGTK